MKKKLLIMVGIILVISVIVIVIINANKKPGTYAIVIGTKNGIKTSKLENEGIVDIKKGGSTEKNTMTDKKTGQTIVQDKTNVRFDLTAKKKGKTTLTVEYDDYKTGETKIDVYDIEVDNKLKITVKKH